MLEDLENKDIWKKFHDNISHSAAHYLMAIDELVKNQGYARLVDISKKLDTSIGSLSTSLKPLIKKAFISQDENKHFQLTELGENIATQIKHTNIVIEYLLHTICGVDKSVAQTDACKIEHLLSRESTLALLKLAKQLSSQSIEQKLPMKETCSDCTMCKDKDCIGDILKSLK